MTEPTAQDDSPADAGRSDESRDISDVGLPHAGDDALPDVAEEAERDRAALDEVFPPEQT